MRVAIGFVSLFVLATFATAARDKWTELNIGPFYVDTDSDPAAARQALTQLEQLRWVLSGLLEIRDLNTIWPIRVLISQNAKTNPKGEFVWQNGQYLLLSSSNARLPLGQLAGIFLEANTPRLPAVVESGFRQLFDTLEAQGSRVTWGGPPAHPDLAWARLQLFATKFEYTASFHIFLSSLKSGSTLKAAEKNAFGKDPDVLEQEAASRLAANVWQPVAASGRPLDPKRDFGEHALDGSLAAAYVGVAELASNRTAAEAAFKVAIAEGGPAAAIGFEGMAQLAKQDEQDPKPSLQDAIRAGSKSAPVYVDAADDLPPDQSGPLLKKAAFLNPQWAEPVYLQAMDSDDHLQQETLLKQAVHLNPRISKYWVELAKVQVINGHAQAAQGSWLRAEDAAADDTERNHVRKLRIAAEQERLDAADAERRRDRDEVHLADQRAQKAEADRVRAAEERANQAAAAASSPSATSDTVPWSSLEQTKKLQGALTLVDCLRHGAARLTVKDRSGKTLQLYLDDLAPTKLSCGVQAPPKRVSLSYHAQADETRHTAGDVVDFEWH